MHYYYGLDKQILNKKLFGVFKHKKFVRFDPLLKGTDEEFYIPHSRHTTVLTEEIANSIKRLNADRVVVTTKEDISLVLKEELEAGHGVDVAIDCLGGEIMGKCIHYLTHGARWIMIAALAGTKTEIDLKNIYVRNVRIVGSTLRSRTPAVKAEILASLVRDVYPKIEAGLVKPTIHTVLPITEAEAAHDILYKGQNVGKVVLTVE